MYKQLEVQTILWVEDRCQVWTSRVKAHIPTSRKEPHTNHEQSRTHFKSLTLPSRLSTKNRQSEISHALEQTPKHPTDLKSLGPSGLPDTLGKAYEILHPITMSLQAKSKSKGLGQPSTFVLGLRRQPFTARCPISAGFWSWIATIVWKYSNVCCSIDWKVWDSIHGQPQKVFLGKSPWSCRKWQKEIERRCGDSNDSMCCTAKMYMNLWQTRKPHSKRIIA